MRSHPATGHATVRIVTHSAAETRDLGRALAAVAAPGDRVDLIGPLGAGKTQLAKGFARGLGVHGVVSSPSFTLMAEHAGRLPLFHQDLYRLGGLSDALDGGLLDERQGEGVTLVEWADRLGPGVDPERLVVRIAVIDEDRRRVTLEAPPSGSCRRYLDAAVTWAPSRDATATPVA